jgi:hypothetical protein
MNENESANERKENDDSTNDSREGSADDNLKGTADDNIVSTANDWTRDPDKKLHVDIIFKYDETGTALIFFSILLVLECIFVQAYKMTVQIEF